MLDPLVLLLPAVGAGCDGRESHVVIGAVVGIFIADDMIVDGRVDERRMAPLTRLGYMNYGTLGEVFAMARPSSS